MLIFDLYYLAKQWRSIHIDLTSSFGRRQARSKPDWAEFRRIVAHYRLPSRHYHGLDHLVYGLKCIDRLGIGLSNLATAKLAFFYHDIIYVKGEPGSNEKASADEAFNYSLTKFPGYVSAMVVKLIEQTGDHQGCVSRAPLWLVMNDADLAILGTPWEVYKTYARNVWQEYKGFGVSMDDYISGRQGFLIRFAAKRIYRLPSMIAEHEAVAKTNLRREAAALATMGAEFLGET